MFVYMLALVAVVSDIVVVGFGFYCFLDATVFVANIFLVIYCCCCFWHAATVSMARITSAPLKIFTSRVNS